MLIRKMGIVVLLLLVAGCSSLRYHIHDDVVVAENQPIRVVPVKLLVEHGKSRADCLRFVERVSRNYTEPQAGIVLDVCYEGEVIFDRKEGPEKMALDLAEWNTFDPACDGLLIACVSDNAAAIGELFGYSWIGWIDDKWRRFILMRKQTDWALAHEVFHAFILTHDHSATGLMGPLAIGLLPFMPALHDTYLSPADRQEVLRNKWRKFSMEPVL